MSQRFLVAFFLFLFAASALFLFSRNAAELDPDRNKNWWTLSFVDPHNAANLSFRVENHSDKTFFRYQILSGKTTLADEGFIVEHGKDIVITPAITITPDVRTSVIVTTGEEKKEIYR